MLVYLYIRISGKKLVFFNIYLYPVRVASEATNPLKGGGDGKN